MRRKRDETHKKKLFLSTKSLYNMNQLEKEKKIITRLTCLVPCALNETLIHAHIYHIR